MLAPTPTLASLANSLPLPARCTTQTPADIISRILNHLSHDLAPLDYLHLHNELCQRQDLHTTGTGAVTKALPRHFVFIPTWDQFLDFVQFVESKADQDQMQELNHVRILVVCIDPNMTKPFAAAKENAERVNSIGRSLPKLELLNLVCLGLEPQHHTQSDQWNKVVNRVGQALPMVIKTNKATGAQRRIRPRWATVHLYKERREENDQSRFICIN